ncbi:BON domain-containing protein [Phenylobacterium sp. LjRoot219]|uniref:BON domain-containing protein n=1 Tax=Phenylobacterium sp. LjRoot219 TaxID=3342283 RepID=UPI003ED166D6
MPWDRTREERAREERRAHWDERRDPPQDDYGLADYSTDYGYDPDRRAGYRAAEETGQRADDFGQADYSTDFAYDAEHGRGYRRYAEEDPGYDPAAERDRGYGRPMARGPDARGEREASVREEGRSWRLFGRDDSEARRRRGPSDRVLWAVIVERLEDQRGLDLRDVEVVVDNAEVTLNGTVRRKDDKRRIEDLADLNGVRHVQNNLRVRERRWF